MSNEWEVRMSSSRGVPYFFNKETKVSVWEAPDGLTREQIDNLPGAYHLSRPAKVRASHLLVKHSGSRNPSSWKEKTITRSKNDAINILQGYQTELNQYVDDSSFLADKFSELATRTSDCSSAKKGGDLGDFGPGQMQKPFEDATFALKIGQMSDIVDTDSGVHLILRTA